MGRKSTYNAKDAAEIVERLSKGEPLAVICRDEHMPAYRTVYRWMDENAEFSASIASARVDGFDAIAAECLSIADTPEEGEETTVKADGAIEKRTGDMLGHRKLKIETRLKLLAKWDPKRYGDRQQVEHSVAVPEELAEWLDRRG
jgi:hypothetical protein